MFKILSAAAAAAVLMSGLAIPAAAGVAMGGLVTPADSAPIGPAVDGRRPAPAHGLAGVDAVSDLYGQPILVHGKHYYRKRRYYPRRHRRYRDFSGWGVVITIPAYPYYRYYDDDYYPRRTYRRSRTRYYRNGLEPWTRAWYRYCRKKYRSFNSKTGYYKTYSGRYRFCR